MTQPVGFKGRWWNLTPSPVQHVCEGCHVLELNGGIPCDVVERPPCGLDFILTRANPHLPDDYSKCKLEFVHIKHERQDPDDPMAPCNNHGGWSK